MRFPTCSVSRALWGNCPISLSVWHPVVLLCRSTVVRLSGSYAYSIYLFHGFGTSGGRIILKMMGIDAVVPILLSATFIAAIGPVLVDKLLGCSRILRILFLGKK
jgi:hypothetical protein